MDLGFSEKEAKLYLLCLKAGTTTANRLIELSGFPRGTAYNVLEKLKSKGMISSFINNKTTNFRANDPEIIIKNFDELKINAQKIIPKLKDIREKIGAKVKIEVFEGTGGVRKVLDEILENAKSYIIVGNEEKAEKILHHLSENFKTKRLEKKIKIKNLLEESETARKLKDNRYSEVRHLSSLNDTEVFLMLYNHVVVRIILDESITTIRVTSEKYAKDQRITFEKLWALGKK